MRPIIQQLQIDATNKDVSTSQLLRKAKIAAVKLGLKDFLIWINFELDGYANDAILPSYRTVPVELKAFNPFRGWLPVRFQDVETQNTLSSREVLQPLGELETLVKSGNNEDLRMTLSPEAYNAISKAISFDGEIVTFVSSTSVEGILNAVKNKVLDVSLQLESEGILGDAVSFSDEEKEKAKEGSIHIGSIQNFSGALGGVSGNATVNATQNNYSKEAVEQILGLLIEKKNELGLPKEQLRELDVQMDLITLENKKNNPSETKIKKGLLIVKSILEQATGSALGQMFISGITHLL